MGVIVSSVSSSFVTIIKRETESKEISNGSEPDAGTVREDVKYGLADA
jgi:hypothetical protein